MFGINSANIGLAVSSATILTGIQRNYLCCPVNYQPKINKEPIIITLMEVAHMGTYF